MTAITILETAESYVNILLGDYKEPEVVLQLKIDLMIMTSLSAAHWSSACRTYILSFSTIITLTAI